MTDPVAVAGLIVGGVTGLVAAVAGVWAVALTKKGNEAAEQDRKDAAAKRRADLQPRPQIGRATGYPDKVSLHVSNHGNTATTWQVLIQVGNSVYYFPTSATAGCIGVMTSGGDRIKELDETLPANTFKVLVSLAEDLDGTLWNVLEGQVEQLSIVEVLNQAGQPYDLRFS